MGSRTSVGNRLKARVHTNESVTWVTINAGTLPGRVSSFGWESGSTCISPVSPGVVAPARLLQVTSEQRIPDPAPLPPIDPSHHHSHAEDVRELAEIQAVEVISRAAVLMMSAAAEQLGLSAEDPDNPPHRDLDEARQLITALAGLVNAAAPDLGPHAAAFRDGLAGLQGAFREYSTYPDEPGKGPGESIRTR